VDAHGPLRGFEEYRTCSEKPPGVRLDVPAEDQQLADVVGA
jgi:hypothetical protein